MSYTLNLTNGATLVPGGLSDGTIDTSHTPLVLIGKNYAGYGQFLNENFVKLLENFAYSSSPANPLVGQLWWDTTNNVMRVWTGSTWKISTGATSAPASAPPSDLSALGGDLWFDSTNNQLKVYSGSQWITVGPASTTSTGDSGVLPALMNDTAGYTHTIVQFRIRGIVYAIFAYENFSTYTPGFTTIVAGLNWNTTNVPTMGLNNQSVAPFPGNLVVRDGSGGIQTAAISATSASVTGPVSATGGFTGTLTGNASGSIGSFTTLNSSIVNASGTINATAGFNGTMLTTSQQNITQLGNVYNLSTNGTTTLTGYATYNGAEIATQGGTTSFNSINNTPIGGLTPSTGAFTSLTVGVGGITPVSNAVISLGTPSLYWNAFYSNTAVHNSMVVAGNTTVGGNVAVTANVITPNLNATTRVVTPAINTVTANVATAINAGGATLTINNTNVNGNITPTANLVSNLGTSTSWFNNIYGTAIHALYADLAERFAIDAPQPAGTVVEMGGPKEITQVGEEYSENVFGVISTNAAYLMNSSAGSDLTHPPIAVSGRVPVRVVGQIRKGDRLVSAGRGLAKSGDRTRITAFNVIGRSLVDKLDDAEGIIEAIVKINN